MSRLTPLFVLIFPQLAIAIGGKALAHNQQSWIDSSIEAFGIMLVLILLVWFVRLALESEDD